MKSAMVKPMPASAPPPGTAAQPTPVRQARERRADGEPAERDDAERLADHEPRRDGERDGAASESAASGTPALASAKIGMMTKPDPRVQRGLQVLERRDASRAARCSVADLRGAVARPRPAAAATGRRGARSGTREDRLARAQGRTGVSRPRITPAIVACTPDCEEREPDQRRRPACRRRTSARRAAPAARRRRAPATPSASGTTSIAGGVADRDHEDGADVVGDREREEHDAQAERHARSEQRHAADDEGDVGRHRDAPAARGRPSRPASAR